jgi:hypothetical protein
MFNFGTLATTEEVIPAGSFAYLIGTESGNYGFNSSVGGLVPLGLFNLEISSLITIDENTLVITLGDGNDLIPGYITLDINLSSLGVTSTMVESGTLNSYQMTYIGIRTLLSGELSHSIPVTITPRNAENAIDDFYGAFLIDESGNAIID